MKRSLLAACAALAICAAAPASAADVLRSAPAPCTTYCTPASAYNWTGFYAGATVGYGFSRESGAVDTGFGTTLNTSPGGSGIVGGGTLGYNWQLNRLVLGLEADGNWGNIKGANSQGFSVFGFPGNLDAQSSVDWYATVRARVGYTLGDRNQWLPYLTGGYAVGHASMSGNASVLGFPFANYNISQTKSGYTYGGGVEYKFASNWSAKVEYLRVDLGDISGNAQSLGGSLPISAKSQFDVVRAGVNMSF